MCCKKNHRKGKFEKCFGFAALGVFLISRTIDEILGLHLGRVIFRKVGGSGSYFLTIPALVANFTVAAIIFTYSGSIKNFRKIGKLIDDKNFCSSIGEICNKSNNRNRSKIFLMTTFSLMSVIATSFQAYLSWTSVLQLGKKNKSMSEQSLFALTGCYTFFQSAASMIQAISFSKKAANDLSPSFEKCCRKIKFCSDVHGASNMKEEGLRMPMMSDNLLTEGQEEPGGFGGHISQEIYRREASMLEGGQAK